MRNEKTSFVYVTYIRSTPEKVFEAITRPEVARRYWGHENVSDWQPGSGWEHVRANEQRTVELVGKVVEITAPTRLVITWASASRPPIRPPSAACASTSPNTKTWCG